MKVFVIEGNFSSYNIQAVHTLYIKNNLHDELPELQTAYYMLSDSAITQRNRPFFLPDFAKPCMVQPHLVVKISRLGKHISERFAHRYYEEFSVGTTFTNAGLFRQLRETGGAWEAAKHFEGAASIGEFQTYTVEQRTNPFVLSFMINNQERCSFQSNELLQGTDSLIAALSRYHKLCQGDLLFCGTPTEGIEVKENDEISMTLNNATRLKFRIK